MTAPPPPPSPLTPQFCFHPRLLRDFLRTSRSNIDDTISTHLNALLTPSTTSPFDPRSTTTITPRPSTTTPSRHPIPQQPCQSFCDAVLFPAWQSRTDVLRYCTAVSTSPDPNDPDAVQREVERHEMAARVVDERLDPYSGRFFGRQARTEQLGSLLRNEEAVEHIVRGRTWGVVAERCEGVEIGEGWEGALQRWKEREGARRR